MHIFSKLKRGSVHAILLVVAVLLVGTSVTLLASDTDLEDTRPIEFISGLVSTPCPEVNCPKPVKNKIEWKTSQVKLEAKDFYIIADGKKFLGNVEKSKLTSTSPDANHTTLEVEWTENNTPMALYMYFERNKKKWHVTEIRTYNGQSSSGWIYYDGIGDQIKMGNKLKIDNIVHKNNNNPANTASGEIYFRKLKLKAFSNSDDD